MDAQGSNIQPCRSALPSHDVTMQLSPCRCAVSEAMATTVHIVSLLSHHLGYQLKGSEDDHPGTYKRSLLP